MKRSHLPGAPCIAQNVAHAAVVTSLEILHPFEIEAFFFRLTRSHMTALFLREVMYEFMPSERDLMRPRATLYRDGFYWFGQTRKAWREKHEFSRGNLETAYRRCAHFLTVDHFMCDGFRTTFYRLDFEKLLSFIDRDQKLQARVQAMRGRTLLADPPRMASQTGKPVGSIDWDEDV